MKKIVSTLLLALTLFCLNIEAQTPDRVSILRERIEQAKLREIRQNLRLNQATFFQFRPIYLRYEREIARIDFKNQAKLMKINVDSLTVQEADQLIVSQLTSARRLVFIREKYYKEFRSVLTPQQIVKLYRSEADLRKKVMAEKKKRMMNW